MSYDGTVRCGHCWKLGHNKRTCPEIKKLIEESPDGYYARKYKDKWKKKKRKCSFCERTGHNKATCSELKEAIPKLKKRLNNWRSKMKENMEKHGLGIGALLQVENLQYYCNKDYEYKTKKCATYMVTQYRNFDQLVTLPAFGATCQYEVILARELGGEHGHWLYYPQDKEYQFKQYANDSIIGERHESKYSRDVECSWSVVSKSEPKLSKDFDNLSDEKVKEWMKENIEDSSAVNIFLRRTAKWDCTDEAG